MLQTVSKAYDKQKEFQDDCPAGMRDSGCGGDFVHPVSPVYLPVTIRREK